MQTSTKTDRRVIRTKQAIHKALTELLEQKDIADITVSELAQTAAISRKTFYNYYNTIYEVLDEIENEHISDLEFVELNACNGGCVGGALTVENPYIAKARLQNLKRYLPVSRNLVEADGKVPEAFRCKETLRYQPVLSLSEDKAEAMQKMLAIEKLNSEFPHMDCGSCGAPTCRALAEDIVSGEASPVDCIIKWRDEIKQAFAKVSPVPEARHED